MIKKQETKVLALVFILVLTMQTVFAFGVTPGRTTITYDVVDREFFFTVINSEAEDINLRFSTSGDLGEHIILDENQAEMSADEKYRLFRFTLSIEDDFKTPGDYKGKINIEKAPKDSQGFGVGLSVNSQVVLKVTETSIPLRKDIFVKEEELSIQDASKINAVFLIILLLVLILVLLNKFIKRK